MSRGPLIPGMLLGLLALAGCQDGPQHIGSDDPMRGGALTAQAGPTGPAPPTSPAGALPGLPAPASTTSTAALTTVDQSLESEPSLRIPGTPVSLQGSGNQAIMIQAPSHSIPGRQGLRPATVASAASQAPATTGPCSWDLPSLLTQRTRPPTRGSSPLADRHPSLRRKSCLTRFISVGPHGRWNRSRSQGRTCGNSNAPFAIAMILQVSRTSYSRPKEPATQVRVPSAIC